MNKSIYAGILLCIIGLAGDYNRSNNIHKDIQRHKEFKKMEQILWSADTLVKQDPKGHRPLYEIILPDSIINKDLTIYDTLKNMDEYHPNPTIKNLLLTDQRMETESLDLKIKGLKEYNKFMNTREKEHALKAIAYFQYIATRFPGTDGSEYKKYARRIDQISREMKGKSE